MRRLTTIEYVVSLGFLAGFLFGMLVTIYFVAVVVW